jgi:hypothetical protein
MHIDQLFESEASDSASRREAVEAFSTIKIWLKLAKPRDLYDYPLMPGSFVFRTQDAGLPYTDLYVVLCPKSDEIWEATFGHTEETGTGVIFLPVLIGPHDLQNADARFGAMKSEFVHEFMHYLMRSRIPAHVKGSTDAAARGDFASYFNNPDETNAYFQQAAQDINDVTTSLIKAGEPARGILTAWTKQSMPNLIHYMEKKFFRDDFLRYLNTKNRRALHKRLARFLQISILPQVRDALDILGPN